MYYLHGVLNMGLPKIPEPKDAKARFKREFRENPRLADAAIRQGTWFTKPYWDTYKNLLKDMGISWQVLMEAWGRVSYEFVRWVRDEETWENALKKLEESVDYLLKIRRKT